MYREIRICAALRDGIDVLYIGLDSQLARFGIPFQPIGPKCCQIAVFGHIVNGVSLDF